MDVYLHILGDLKKSITGNYQFFEMDQNRLRAVINHLNQAGIGEHIYCILCGRMSPDQIKKCTGEL
jgi:hypothetical protein